MLTTAFATQRIPALESVLPASWPAWAAAEPCLHSVLPVGNHLPYRAAFTQRGMHGQDVDQRGSRGVRGVQTRVLTRSSPM